MTRLIFMLPGLGIIVGTGVGATLAMVLVGSIYAVGLVAVTEIAFTHVYRRVVHARKILKTRA